MRQMTPMVTVEDRQRLSGIVQRGEASEMMVLRARIVLASGTGSRREIARELGVAGQTVTKWWRRYQAEGVNGLYDRPRSGKPRRFARDELIAMINHTLSKDCPSRMAWSVRSVAKEMGLSPATVGRAWRDLVREQRGRARGGEREAAGQAASAVGATSQDNVREDLSRQDFACESPLSQDGLHNSSSHKDLLARDSLARGAAKAGDAAGSRLVT